MNPVKIGFWRMALPVLLAVSQGAVANAEPLFDETKRVVLPSEAATTVLEYVTDGSVRTGEWTIDPATLDLVEVALASALAKQGFGVRVYVPFGPEWYPYFMRRLAERPANVLFLIKNFLKS